MKNWLVRTSRNCWLSSMLAACSNSRADPVATMPRWSGQDRMSTFSVGTALVSGTAAVRGTEPGQNGGRSVSGRGRGCRSRLWGHVWWSITRALTGWRRSVR